MKQQIFQKKGYKEYLVVRRCLTINGEAVQYSFTNNINEASIVDFISPKDMRMIDIEIIPIEVEVTRIMRVI